MIFTSVFLDLVSDSKFGNHYINKQLLGMACNFLALYLIVRKSKDYLSEYRKLLIIFLASDMIFALLHSIAKPIGVLEGNLLLMYLTGHIRHRNLMAIYLSFVSGSFPILSFHFVYRALAIRSYADAAHSHFVTYNLIFPDNPQEELILFLAYEDGVLNVPALKRIALIMAVTSFTGFFIIVSIVVIIRTLRLRTKANYYWRKIHLQLFIALLVQLLIPSICLYIPTTFYLLSVFMPNSSVYTPPSLLGQLYSWFPIADPIAIILLISDYRTTIIRPLIQIFKKASGIIPNSAIGPMEAINNHLNKWSARSFSSFNSENSKGFDEPMAIKRSRRDASVPYLLRSSAAKEDHSDFFVQ
ncbi:hypothetical protein PRIPAC_77702, partial [Pristionchus pacificus]|uniref:G protein-coupled receptor n=1 Tax=Pristionchus pacificus TaxID=54126 RepID=A0A2A6CN39_PRIPA